MVTVSLPSWPWEVVHQIAAQRGLQVWPVGGVVRDLLMGRARHDWDFTVDRDALGLARAVADALGGAFYPLDEERDTGRVILWAGGRRIELDFAGLRGANLEADLRGRDFTINAMAVGPDGRLVDPTGGLADLQARRLRAVGPEAFDQDPLRMLRAVRLVAELSLRLDAQTAQWIIQRATALSRVSAERVRDELARLLAAPAVAYYLQLADELGLLAQMIPEVDPLKEQRQTYPHRFNVWWHTLMTIEAAENLLRLLTDAPLLSDYTDAPAQAWKDVRSLLQPLAPMLTAHFRQRLAANRTRRVLFMLTVLCHDVGKPQTVTEDERGRLHFYGHELTGAQLVIRRLRALRFSRAETERAATVIRGHLRPAQLADAPGGVTGRAVYRFFRATGDAGVDVVLLALADHLSIWGPHLQPDRWARRLNAAGALLSYFFEKRSAITGESPLVNGCDLMRELNLAEGPLVGRLLEAVREAQAAGEVRTREEALTLARRLLHEKGSAEGNRRGS